MPSTLVSHAIVPAAPGFKLIFQTTDDPADLQPQDDVVAWRIETRKEAFSEDLVSRTLPLTVEGETSGGEGVRHPDGKVTGWRSGELYLSLGEGEPARQGVPLRTSGSTTTIGGCCELGTSDRPLIAASSDCWSCCKIAFTEYRGLPISLRSSASIRGWRPRRLPSARAHTTSFSRFARARCFTPTRPRRSWRGSR